MSATINSGKLKFSVFGNGFEETRNDSGYGGKTDQRIIWYNSDTAVIDQSGEYFWHTQGGGSGTMTWIAKRKISDLSSVSIGSIPYTKTYLYHPTNIENNIGIAFQNFGNNADVYIFDLTDNTIDKHFNVNTGSFYDNATADCIKVGDIYYFTLRGSGNCITYKLDPINETFAVYSNPYFNNGAGCGFVDNDTIYAFNNPVWFSDYGHRYGININGVYQWDIVAPNAGGSGFPNTHERALCENGYIWLPTKVNNIWRWGKYDGNTGAGMTIPSPLKIIGKFGDTNPTYDDFHIAYEDGHKRCAYVHATMGTFFTDFEEVEKVTDEYWKPLAMNDHYLIMVNRIHSQTGVFRYR